LKRPLTRTAPFNVALPHNTNASTYEEIGIAQADVIEAGFASETALSIERRFPRTGVGAELVTAVYRHLISAISQRAAKAQLAAAKSRVGNEILNVAAEVRDASDVIKRMLATSAATF